MSAPMFYCLTLGALVVSVLISERDIRLKTTMRGVLFTALYAGGFLGRMYDEMYDYTDSAFTIDMLYVAAVAVIDLAAVAVTGVLRCAVYGEWRPFGREMAEEAAGWVFVWLMTMGYIWMLRSLPVLYIAVVPAVMALAPIAVKLMDDKRSTPAAYVAAVTCLTVTVAGWMLCFRAVLVMPGLLTAMGVTAPYPGYAPAIVGAAMLFAPIFIFVYTLTEKE